MVSIVLARMLNPSEVGVFSITAVLVGIAHIFRDFGVSSYLQQEKDLTREKVASAFGVMIATSWTIALFIYTLSPFAADFYDEVGVEKVMKVLAIGFLFIPFGSITNALLTREYRAQEQAYVMVVGTVTYALTATGLAFAGFSYMAMAWANLANIVAAGLAFLPFRPKIVPWLPSLRGWRNVLHFGGGAVLGNSLNTLNNSIPDLVLGRISGPHDVGIMSRAASTTNLISQVLTPTAHYAALPYLSKIHHGNQSMGDSLTRAIIYITGLMWPALALIYLNANEIILILYGSQWIECAPVVKILCLAAAVTVPFSFTNFAFMAIGKPYLTSIPTLALIGLKAGFLIWIYDGSLTSFAYALTLATISSIPLQMGIQQLALKIKSFSFLISMWRSFLVASVCTLGSLAWIWLPDDTSTYFSLVLKTTTTGILWVSAIYLTGHPLIQELNTTFERVKKIMNARFSK